MPTPSDHERLVRLLGGDALRPLRARLRRRFARLPIAPQITLARIALHELRTLGGRIRSEHE